MEISNPLKFPTTTLLGKTVPKTAFYRHLEMNAKMKQRFVDDVTGITWLYKLAPTTLNVEDGKNVHEIVIFHVLLKNRDCPDDVFLFIDKNMPRHVVFILQYEDQIKLLLNYKEWQDQNKGTFTIVKEFTTAWMDYTHLQLPLDGGDLDKVYETFVGCISGYGTNRKETTQQIIELEKLIDQKTREVAALKNKVKNEKQVNRQIVLNTEARSLQREIDTLRTELNQLKKNNI